MPIFVFDCGGPVAIVVVATGLLRVVGLHPRAVEALVHRHILFGMVPMLDEGVGRIAYLVSRNERFGENEELGCASAFNHRSVERPYTNNAARVEVERLLADSDRPRQSEVGHDEREITIERTGGLFSTPVDLVDDRRRVLPRIDTNEDFRDLLLRVAEQTL